MADKADETFSYDKVAYPSPVLETLNPDRLRASALLHGFSPKDAATASVLEIGCGDGYSQIAWAAIAPQARVVGFDLSELAIAKGKELVEAAALTNVDLHVGDILTYPRDGEKFDYIVCHGVLSWIPEAVRGPLLELISARLAPGGLAYVSFDCLPGAANKAALVPFLRSRLTADDDPVKAAGEARVAANLISRAQRPHSRIQDHVNLMVDTMTNDNAAYIYHDWLAEHYGPINLRELIDRAGVHNLRLAGSAANVDLHYDDLDPEAQALLDSYGDDHGARLLAIDLMRGPFLFHRDFLVRIDAPPPKVTDGEKQLSFYFDGKREELQTERGTVKRYFYDETVTLSTYDAEAQAVLDLLFERQPVEVPFDEIRAVTKAEELELRHIIDDICRSHFVDARTTPMPFVLEPGERPVAGLLARVMALSSSDVVNLRCMRVELAQDETRLLFTLCDGTRTRGEIAAAMSEKLGRYVPLAMVEGAITHFARRRLFSA